MKNHSVLSILVVAISIVLLQAGYGVTKESSAIQAEKTAPMSKLVATGSKEERMTELAKDDLAALLGVKKSDISIESVTEEIWTSGALGFPEKGKFYTQALVNGYRIILIHKGKRYEYHTNSEGYVKLDPKARSASLKLSQSLSAPIIESKADISPDDIIDYVVMDNWEYSKARERWLGPDPTFKLARRIYISIRVTLYGLEGSRINTPEEFEEPLDQMFMGDQKTIETVMIDGAKAKSIRIYSERGDHIDYHGGYVPPDYILDEFVILPLEEGFLVFNFTAHWHVPLPDLSLSPEEADSDTDRAFLIVLQEWQSFLKSCRFKERNN